MTCSSSTAEIKSKSYLMPNPELFPQYIGSPSNCKGICYQGLSGQDINV